MALSSTRSRIMGSCDSSFERVAEACSLRPCRVLRGDAVQPCAGVCAVIAAARQGGVDSAPARQGTRPNTANARQGGADSAPARQGTKHCTETETVPIPALANWKIANHKRS